MSVKTTSSSPCHLIIVLLFSLISIACCKMIVISEQDIVMYSGASLMDLESARSLCRSLGGDLPILENMSEDLAHINTLTIEPVWVGVVNVSDGLHHGYMWQDGTILPKEIIERKPSTGKPPCNTSCCSLRLRPISGRLSEVNCNETNLPICVIEMTSDNMNKLIRASNDFNSEDKLAIALDILPRITSHLYDESVGHSNRTHPIIFVLIAIISSLLILLVVMTIIIVRNNRLNISANRWWCEENSHENASRANSSGIRSAANQSSGHKSNGQNKKSSAGDQSEGEEETPLANIIELPPISRSTKI